MRLSTFNLQPSTFNLQPSTFNLQPSTFNLQPSTFNQAYDHSLGKGIEFFITINIVLKDSNQLPQENPEKNPADNTLVPDKRTPLPHILVNPNDETKSIDDLKKKITENTIYKDNSITITDDMNEFITHEQSLNNLKKAVNIKIQSIKEIPNNNKDRDHYQKLLLFKKLLENISF